MTPLNIQRACVPFCPSLSLCLPVSRPFSSLSLLSLRLSALASPHPHAPSQHQPHHRGQAPIPHPRLPVRQHHRRLPAHPRRAQCHRPRPHLRGQSIRSKAPKRCWNPCPRRYEVPGRNSPRQGGCRTLAGLERQSVLQLWRDRKMHCGSLHIWHWASTCSGRHLSYRRRHGSTGRHYLYPQSKTRSAESCTNRLSRQLQEAETRLWYKEAAE